MAINAFDNRSTPRHTIAMTLSVEHYFVTLDNAMPFDKALLSFLAGRKTRF
jgi:hypothetical protein